MCRLLRESMCHANGTFNIPSHSESNHERNTKKIIQGTQMVHVNNGINKVSEETIISTYVPTTPNVDTRRRYQRIRYAHER